MEESLLVARVRDEFGVTLGTPLAYHRCVRALEDLGELAEQVRAADRWDRARREEALGHARGVLSETGLIRQALGR